MTVAFTTIYDSCRLAILSTIALFVDKETPSYPLSMKKLFRYIKREATRAGKPYQGLINEILAKHA
jgi:hypothetical protein